MHKSVDHVHECGRERLCGGGGYQGMSAQPSAFLSMPSLDVSAESGITISTSVRLVDGPNRCTGRVEVLHNDVWGTVCDDGWDLREAKVVCKQLGCGTALSALPESKYGEGKGQIWLTDVNCTGTEGSITECETKPWGENTCNHVEDASVVCSGNHL